MRLSVLNTLAGLLGSLSVIFWTPLSNWFIEIYSPSTKMLVLNAFVLTVSIVLFKSTSNQSRKKGVAFWTIAVVLLISSITSMLFVLISTIPPPLDTFGFDDDFQVGPHHVEARKSRIYNLSSGSGEILVREIKPLSPGVRLVRQPIAVGDEVTGVALRKIDNNSFTYQFIGEEVDYPLCTVHFNN